MQKLENWEFFDAEKLKGGSDYEGLMRMMTKTHWQVQRRMPLSSLQLRNWIEKVPSNFKALMSNASSDYYIAGWKMKS